MSETPSGHDLEAIEELMENGELADAADAVEAALAGSPDAETTQALLILRAEIALESEDFDETIAATADALNRVEDDDPRAQLLSLKAYAHYYLDDLEEARKAFNESIRLGGATWNSLVGRALVHDDLLYFQAALLDLDRAIHLDDQEAHPFAIRGHIRLRTGELDAARADLSHALSLDPDDEETRLNLARLLAIARHSAQAIETLEPLVESGDEPEFIIPAALLRSQLSLALGSTDAACEDAQVAIDLAPDQPWGYLQLAASHLTAMCGGDAIAALKQAEKQVDDVRDVPDIFALRATAYEQLEKTDKAARDRDRAEGAARLPGIVYGEWLNPARNIPLNPNKPFDVRGLLAELFGDPKDAPEGYENTLRQLIDRIPELVQQNPNAGQLRIELPRVEGMTGPPRSLVVQVGKAQQQAQKS